MSLRSDHLVWQLVSDDGTPHGTLRLVHLPTGLVCEAPKTGKDDWKIRETLEAEMEALVLKAKRGGGAR